MVFSVYDVLLCLSVFLDKNECAQFGVCSHICNNTKGSYKCSCYKYFTKINDTCKADSEWKTLQPFLLSSPSKLLLQVQQQPLI